MTTDHNSVFISYRRDASKYMARAIFQDLRTHNYDVFMDVESVDAGNFDTIILNQIRARTHFLLILAPGTLERCVEPNDWLRKEIEIALEYDRNIVLLFAEHFDFKKDSKYLTGKLVDLPRRNGTRVPHDFFDAAMEKLRTRFLKKRLDIPLQAVPDSDVPVITRKMAEVATEPPVQQEELNIEAEVQRLYDSATDKWRTRDYQDALIDCEAALRLNPDYAEIFMRRGTIETELEQYWVAIVDYNHAIRLRPDFAFAYHNRGNVHCKLGQFEAAIADYDTVIRLKPDLVNAYASRGQAHKALGNYQQAIEDYQRFLDLGGTWQRSDVEQWIRDLKAKL